MNPRNMDLYDHEIYFGVYDNENPDDEIEVISMNSINLEWYDHGLYLSRLNKDGTTTAINKSDLIETELNYQPGPELNNLIGRILLIIIAIPFMFKAVK